MTGARGSGRPGPRLALSRHALLRLAGVVGLAALMLPLAAVASRPATRGSVASVAGAAADRHARARGIAQAGGTPGVAAGGSPPGFWSGTDSFTMPVTGSGPYKEPVTGGNYGGYTGMAGNWAHWQGCGGKLVWSARNARQASANRTTYHKGVGVGAFW